MLPSESSWLRGQPNLRTSKEAGRLGVFSHVAAPSSRWCQVKSCQQTTAGFSFPLRPCLEIQAFLPYVSWFLSNSFLLWCSWQKSTSKLRWGPWPHCHSAGQTCFHQWSISLALGKVPLQTWKRKIKSWNRKFPNTTCFIHPGGYPERVVALIWFETPDLEHAHNSRPRQSQYRFLSSHATFPPCHQPPRCPLHQHPSSWEQLPRSSS